MQKVVAFVAVWAVLAIPALAALCSGTASAEESSYVLKVDVSPAKKGQKAVAKVHITPGAGYHMNKEYPTSLVFTTVPAGVSVDKMKLTAKDAAKFEEAGAEFDIAYTAAQLGKKVVSGEIKFAVCSATTCDPKKSAVSFEIDVK
jgi:hypothetical protein